jgi:hypothetical protein
MLHLNAACPFLLRASFTRHSISRVKCVSNPRIQINRKRHIFGTFQINEAIAADSVA